MATDKQEEWEEVELSPTWDFKKDKELIAFFVSTEANVGPNNSLLHTFRMQDNSLISAWGNSVLDKRLKSLLPGDKVKIVYLGSTKNDKTGRSYHNFKVYRNKAGTKS